MVYRQRSAAVVDPAAAVGGSITGENAVAHAHCAMVEDTSTIEGAIAGEGTVADDQRAIGVDTAADAAIGASIGNSQAIQA